MKSVTDSTAILWGGTTLEKLTIGADFDVGILLRSRHDAVYV